MTLTLPQATATNRQALGPVVLLTGAAHGIGRATATALVARGYRLGLIDRAEGPLTALADELKVLARAADVRDAAAVKEAVAAIECAVGPTDVLVPCAGVGSLSSVLDLDLDGFRAMLEVNV